MINFVQTEVVYGFDRDRGLVIFIEIGIEEGKTCLGMEGN